MDNNGENKPVGDVIARTGDLRTKRKLVITTGSEASTDTKQNLANWEMTRRLGQRYKWTYTVQGWIGQNSLWRPGESVFLSDDFIYQEAELLIESVTYNFSEAGTTTTLELLELDAYAYKPPTEPKHVIKKDAKHSENQISLDQYINENTKRNP